MRHKVAVNRVKTQYFCFRFWIHSPKIPSFCLLCFDNGLFHWIFVPGPNSLFLTWLALVWKSDKCYWIFFYTLYLVSFFLSFGRFCVSKLWMEVERAYLSLHISRKFLILLETLPWTMWLATCHDMPCSSTSLEN